MRPWSRSTVGSTLGVLVGSLLVVVCDAPDLRARPPATITWDGTGDGTDWTDNQQLGR